MIEWVETDSGFRVYDSAKTEITIDAPDWERGAFEHEITSAVDATLTGYASELRFSPAVAHVTQMRTDENYELGSKLGPLELPDDEYLIQIHENIKTYIRFSGPVTLRKTADYDELIISFPAKTAMTLGFWSRLQYPSETITVPPTPSGLATALSHLHSSHETTSPDRSYHAQRSHPPLVNLGDETTIPSDIVAETSDTGIELVLPAQFEDLFVAAPLAYYLQADVSVEERDNGVLKAPDVGVSRTLDPMPDLQHDVAGLLRRMFFLDCLVRNAGPNATNLAEYDLLDTIGIDAADTYAADPAERLRTYLAAPFDAIVDDLPEWHLSMYVSPIQDNVSTLPFLLNNLSLVYLPKTSELEGKERMERSLGDFYRGGQEDPPVPSDSDSPGRATGSRPVASIDIVKPQLEHGRVHGWMADGIPIDVFKTIPQAYENRLDYFERGSESITITVVLNDREMGQEHSMAAEIYENRAEDFPIDITVREHLTCDELAEVFETPNDLVHYIGHCEVDGLRCVDGNLSVSDIEESNAQTFFLNACGSYYEGIELIEKGSVAGAVTFKQVLNEQAAKVGTAFARLLINGFSIERALRLSRRRIMMGKDYAVVGDGTHVLTQCDNYIPLTATVDQVGDDEFELECDVFSAQVIGGYYQPYIAENDTSYLYGTGSTFTLDRAALLSYLDRAKMPVVYDGDFYWSEELSDELAV